MLSILPIALAIIERGLIYSLIVFGVYVTSRIIKFDDLSVEGSFGIGGALTAFCLLQGIPSWLALISAAFGGACTGLATGLLHTKLQLNNLISGIIVTTALFSITLAVGGANATLMGVSTIFTPLLFLPFSLHFLIILLPLTIGIVYFLRYFLHSEVGFLLYAVGDNPQMLTNLGKHIDRYKIMALMINNTLSALAGSLFVQYVGYFSIWSNVGILIIALASLIIGELLNRHLSITMIIGSIIYQALIALTFELQFAPEWNKLITAILITLLLTFKTLTKQSSRS